MNRDEARPPQAGLAYCKNKASLDSFMAERVNSVFNPANEMRARYRQRVQNLGQRLNGYCKNRTMLAGPAFAPIEKITTAYTGPSID